MLLGGIRYLLPVIKAAHEQGYYVITADYLPDNIAHKFSDEYVNVSIIKMEAFLKAAIKPHTTTITLMIAMASLVIWNAFNRLLTSMA